MQIRKFMRELDFQKLNEWLHAHGHAYVQEAELPMTGFVVEDEGAEIAMAFLRMVEGNMAIAESLVTDPAAPLCKRVRAIDQVIEKLFETAISRDIKYLMATTFRSGVVSRITKRHGFQVSDQTMLIKKL